MKYKKLSFLVIILTMISVSAMFLYDSGDEKIRKLFSDARSFNLSNLNFLNNFNSKRVINESKVIERTNFSGNGEEKNNTRQNNIVSPTQESNSKSKAGTAQDNTNNSVKNVKVPIVVKADVRREISLAERLQIQSLSNKISPIDYGRINEFLKDSDENSAVIKVFSLLWTRLSSSDYKKVKENASDFIDFNTLESEIAKNNH